MVFRSKFKPCFGKFKVNDVREVTTCQMQGMAIFDGIYSKGTFSFSVRWNKIPNPEMLGNFDLLIDEEIAAQDDGAPNNNGKSRSNNNRWK